ncbi:MAG: glucose-6-phosphate isomerase family protein [Patescibacteria group bacterium]
MKVLLDKEWLKKTKNSPVYYIKRGVKKKNGLRYDITIVPAKMLGKEFVKTKGHEHKNSYQEFYIVLEGKAIFLTQKGQGTKIKEAYAIQAKKGESVIIPPFFGHVTINPSKKDLKIGNWIDENCKNDYKLFEKMKGACYYYTQSGWIKNKNYKKVPKLIFKKPSKGTPKNLEFLKKIFNF